MRTALILSLCLLAAACKGKPKHQAPPTNVQTPAASAGSAGSGGMKPAPDITLPKSAGGPPVKTTQPLDEATLRKLADMTFPGFQLQKRGLTDKLLELRQKTEDHPVIWATVTLSHCFDCLPMDVAKWKEKTDALKLFLTPELKAASDTVFEVGQTEVNGTPMIFTYQLAQTPPGDHYAYSHAYVLYYNDGVNQARVVAEYKDDPLPTKEKMAEMVPRADLENVAKAFMDVYTHAW